MPSRRPRPVVPILWTFAAIGYTAVAAIAWLAPAELVYAIVWTILALIWWAFTVPVSIRTHRTRVEIWEMTRRRRTLGGPDA